MTVRIGVVKGHNDVYATCLALRYKMNLKSAVARFSFNCNVCLLLSLLSVACIACNNINNPQSLRKEKANNKNYK